MKHSCHCGFEKRHHLAKGKRLGLLGASLMVLHLLYHVAECLILPAIFMAWSGHHSEPAVAASDETTATSELSGSDFLETTFAEKQKLTLAPRLYTNFFETLH